MWCVWKAGMDRNPRPYPWCADSEVRRIANLRQAPGIDPGACLILAYPVNPDHSTDRSYASILTVERRMSL
jgi:hypothetical protein